MVPWLLTVVLTSLVPTASPAAQALPDARWSLEVPRLNATASLFAFFEHAGKSSALLAPNAWVGDFHPFLALDPRDTAALKAAGVDPTGPAVISAHGSTKMTCLRLSDSARFDAAARQHLPHTGKVTTGHSGDVRWVKMRDREGATVGYALRGKTACSVLAETGGDLPLERAAAAARKPSPTPIPGGVIRLWGSRGEARLKGDAQTLTAELSGLPSETRIPWSQSPLRLRGKAPSGLISLRGSFEPKGLAALVEPDVMALCSACRTEALHAVLGFLAGEVTGELFWRVDGLRPKPDLSHRAGQLRALRQAGALALAHPDGFAQRLAPLMTAAGAEATGGEGWTLRIDGGRLMLEVKDGLLWFATDTEALVALRAAPDAAAPLGGPGLEATLDGKAVARALGAVSILDLLRAPELAPLAMASLELTPLFEQTEVMTLRMTPMTEGEVRSVGTWRLRGR